MIAFLLQIPLACLAFCIHAIRRACATMDDNAAMSSGWWIVPIAISSAAMLGAGLLAVIG